MGSIDQFIAESAGPPSSITDFVIANRDAMLQEIAYGKDWSDLSNECRAFIYSRSMPDSPHARLAPTRLCFDQTLSLWAGFNEGYGYAPVLCSPRQDFNHPNISHEQGGDILSQHSTCMPNGLRMFWSILDFTGQDLGNSGASVWKASVNSGKVKAMNVPHWPGRWDPNLLWSHVNGAWAPEFAGIRSAAWQLKEETLRNELIARLQVFQMALGKKMGHPGPGVPKYTEDVSVEGGKPCVTLDGFEILSSGAYLFNWNYHNLDGRADFNAQCEFFAYAAVARRRNMDAFSYAGAAADFFNGIGTNLNGAINAIIEALTGKTGSHGAGLAGVRAAKWYGPATARWAQQDLVTAVSVGKVGSEMLQDLAPVVGPEAAKNLNDVINKLGIQAGLAQWIKDLGLTGDDFNALSSLVQDLLKKYA
jgi:hypothetical protein